MANQYDIIDFLKKNRTWKTSNEIADFFKENPDNTNRKLLKLCKIGICEFDVKKTKKNRQVKHYKIL